MKKEERIFSSPFMCARMQGKKRGEEIKRINKDGEEGICRYGKD